MESNQERRRLYKGLDQYETGFLQVSEIHTIYWEVSGNPNGKPALILHGGPGSGSDPLYRGFFDPAIYKIVQFDQRGSGKSTPFASLEENTTWDLVKDCEKIRETLKIEKWHTVIGGSWGSTLTLAYSQTYPERVSHIIVIGVFLLRKEEVDFFYQEGSSWLFPDFHEQMKQLLPEPQQGNILHNYYLKLTGNDEEEKLKFAKAMAVWEMATCKLFIDEEKLKKGKDDKFALAHSRLEAHYFVNGGFFNKKDQLLEDTNKIAHIPTIIIQGRYDMVCPAKSAYDLHKRLPKSELVIISDAGHSGSELGIQDAIVKATDKFSKNDI
ncbi:proline iminopeptidase (macronuclear) [Tetrahymena thermophila SB210]|uniref:Proline iminopeptidase n=1 Tax=Tetrahymena thermophila (strain SB210) TaxID=312017 RepID=I7LXG5_TETTS|nr:proline iminopeptidase [Tetrahymena thermophila SB210]EAS04598.1 proline iminopeptidase [Tetrahymena thermophila SB210]|eukprot:XP_001024843.1 proline iminopeptidase [Tetrahymena thermophila SB210]